MDASIDLVESAGAAPADAPVDLAGEWLAHSRHEDEVHRIPGAELGDYAGLVSFATNDPEPDPAELFTDVVR